MYTLFMTVPGAAQLGLLEDNNCGGGGGGGGGG